MGRRSTLILQNIDWVVRSGNLTTIFFVFWGV